MSILITIADTMAGDTCFQLRARMNVVSDHDVTDEDVVKDRIWKCRPLLKLTKQGCLQLPRSSELAVEELF